MPPMGFEPNSLLSISLLRDKEVPFELEVIGNS